MTDTSKTLGPRAKFGKDAVDPKRRARHWRACMAEVYFDLDVDMDLDEPFRGEISGRTVASTGFESDAHRVIRRKELVSRDKIEQYVFVFATDGWFRYRQLGNEGCAGVGDVYLVRSSEYYEVDMSDNAAMLALSVPCEEFGSRLRGLDDLVSRKNFADPLLVSTLRDVTRNLLASDTIVDAAIGQELCLGIVDLMLAPERLAENESASSPVFVRHMLGKTIAQRLGDPAFGVIEAARACGVSTRKLQLLLQARDSTFGDELMAARLARAALLLKAPGMAYLQIAQIAYRCGFVSAAHFATSYRRRFGRSPRDERS